MNKKNDQIIHEAKERFRRAADWEANARVHHMADTRFGNGDHTNNYQWPNNILDNRLQQQKPCVTVNRVRVYCNQILNDSRQNKAQVEIRPTGGGSSFKSAEIFEGLYRYTENVSNAQEAYDEANKHQIYGGWGYWMVGTEYADDNSFDQDIVIRRITDPLSIYLDCDIQQFDGSDAKWGFHFRDMDRKDFEREYPKHTDQINNMPLGEGDEDSWNSKDRVRVAEYYRIVNEEDTLHHLDNGDVVKESDVKKADPEIRKKLKIKDDAPDLMDQLEINSVKRRSITTPKVEYYLIAGDKIIETNDWLGKYIPIVRVIGEETVIDGSLDRKGHVRGITSSQQSYNYYTSNGIETVALQTKTPWMASLQAIAGVESYYATANTVNHAYIPFNSWDADTAQPIPKPEREPPPQFASAFLDGMKVATTEMEMASGQVPAQMGEESNERSGKAITERQRAGFTSTYHFTNNQAIALRFTGKIFVDLAPKIYDTPRVKKILAEDGTQSTIQIDPTAPQAHTPVPALDPESIDPNHIAANFNPSVGQYDVVCDVGPQYDTRRQETLSALTMILSQNESLAPIVGDLMFRCMDFPMADSIADRLKLMVPKQALGQAPDPMIVQLQQQLAAQHQVMQNMGQELHEAKSKDITREIQKEIDWFRAESERLKVVGAIDPAALMPVVRELVSQVLQQPVNPIIAQHVAENSAMLQQLQPPQDQQQQQQGPQQQ